MNIAPQLNPLMPELSPEFRLVAACCMWPPSEQKTAAIKQAAMSKIDWDRFIYEVGRQRVGGLVYESLRTDDIAMPESVKTHLSARAQAHAVQNIRYLAEALRLFKLFGASGVHTVFLKGASLAQLAYDSIAYKHAKDIDILVKLADVDRAWRLLENEGYQVLEPACNLTVRQRRVTKHFRKNAEFYNAGLHIEVELHWQPIDNDCLLQGVGAASPMQHIYVAKNDYLPTFDTGYLFPYLCAHGAYHAWFRLKWLADVNALIAAKSAGEIVDLYRQANRMGSGLCVGQALLLCHYFLALDIPQDLKKELLAMKEMNFLMMVAGHALTSREEKQEFGGQGVKRKLAFNFKFFLGRGVKHFLQQSQLELVNIYFVIRHPLPRALYFLYPIVGVLNLIGRMILTVVRHMLHPLVGKRANGINS
jgi:hypothetical protein